MAAKQYTEKERQDAQDKRDALEGDTFKDFAEGAYNLLAGTSEGTVRAVVGVPGLIGDGLELGNTVFKAMGWAEDGNFFDEFKKSEYGGLVKGSDYYIQQAGRGADALGLSSAFAKGKSDSTLRNYARTATEFGLPVGAAGQLLVKGGRAVTRAIRGRAQDLIDQGPPLSSYKPSSGTGNASPGPLRSIAQKVGRHADTTGAGIGVAAGVAHEFLDQNKTPLNSTAGSLGTAVILSLLAKGSSRNTGQFIANRMPDSNTNAGREDLALAEELMEIAEKNGIDLSAAEALAQVGDPRMAQELANIMAFGDSAAYGRMVKNREMEGQQKKAVQGQLDTIAGKADDLDEAIPERVTRDLQEGFEGVKEKLVDGPSGALFDQARDVEVPQDVIEQLFARAQKAAQEAGPGTERARAFTQFANNLTKQEMVSQRIPRDGMPVDPKLEPVPQLKIGQLHANYADLRQVLQKKAEGGITTPQQQLQPLQDDLLAALESSSPEFKAGMDVYRRYMPEIELQQMTSAGQVAGLPGKNRVLKSNADQAITPEYFADLMLPTSGKISEKRVKSFFSALRRGDSEIMDRILNKMAEDPATYASMPPKGVAGAGVIRKLVSQMLGARLQEAFNTDSALAGSKAYSRKMYFPEDKKEATHQLLREAAAASGGELKAGAVGKDGIINGFHKLMEVLSATGHQPAVGAPTAGRTASGLEAGRAGQGPGSRGVGVIEQAQIVSQRGGLARFSAWGLEGGRREVYSAMGEVLTKPDGIAILKRLASRKEGGEATARALSRSFLSLVNEAQNDARDQQRSIDEQSLP